MKTLWCKNQENPSDRISHAWAPLNWLTPELCLSLFPQSTHRVAIAVSGVRVHPIMMEKSSPGWWGWRVHAHPLAAYYHHVQSCIVRSCWVGRYTHPVSSLPIYVLCGFSMWQTYSRTCPPFHSPTTPPVVLTLPPSQNTFIGSALLTYHGSSPYYFFQIFLFFWIPQVPKMLQLKKNLFSRADQWLEMALAHKFTK